jgi:hypothetical protein
MPSLSLWLAARLCIATITASASALAQDAPSFKGKTVDIYTGYTVGGGYDLYTRLLARHFGSHLVGGPAVVPKNMEGAASIRLANWLYNAAPKDGTAFGTIGRGTALDPLLGQPGAQFDGTKFNWIGSANDEVGVCVAWHTSGFSTFDDLMHKELLIGGTGPGDDTVQFGKVLGRACPPARRQYVASSRSICSGHRPYGTITAAPVAINVTTASKAAVTSTSSRGVIRNGVPPSTASAQRPNPTIAALIISACSADAESPWPGLSRPSRSSRRRAVAIEIAGSSRSSPAMAFVGVSNSSRYALRFPANFAAHRSGEWNEPALRARAEEFQRASAIRSVSPVSARWRERSGATFHRRRFRDVRFRHRGRRRAAGCVP